MAKKAAKSHVHTQPDIIVKGARMHNLKNIDVVFPRNKFIVVTGVSGSGKSSLTMDTLFAEGQRRYAESLSAYARQFLMRMDKPDVDNIEGISPAIAIEQKVTTRTPRSTVGSMTEIQDYLRLLYARAGITYSPISGTVVKKDEVADVVDYIQSLEPKHKIYIVVPLILHSGRDVSGELAILLQKGFSRLLINQDELVLHEIETILEDKTFIPDIENNIQNVYVLIDRLVTRSAYEDDDIHRIADSVNTAFYENDGACTVLTQFENKITTKVFNNKFEADGLIFEEPTPNLFSFNNPFGACPKCEGFGQILGVDKDLVIPDRTKSVYDDAVICWRGDKMSEWKHDFIAREGRKGFPIHKPIAALNDDDKKTLNKWIDSFFQMVEENLYKIQYRVMLSRYRGRTTCPECNGGRLRKEALYVKIADRTIVDLSTMPIKYLKEWFESLKLNTYQEKVSVRILQELNQRLQTMLDVGLGYLTLYRLANSLSGGESQRIQLTKFLGSNLTDSLYILDEPSIGLHPRDTDRLIKVLHHLRDLNNTVIVVEHDDMMMEKADHIIDMGPLAAHLGGEVIATGDYNAIINNPQSLTGQYLSGKKQVEVDNATKFPSAPYFISLKGCHENNLKNIDVDFPLNCLCVVTGVSGSGKTTLVKQTLYPALLRHLGEGSDKPGAHSKFTGDLKKINHVEMIDQNPIGKSSRSNPVSYIKAYDEIRSLFAKQKQAKLRGFEPKHFSFNTDGGRCDTCKGEGEVVVQMQFLADVHLECEACKGKKFKDEVLEVTYLGKNIYEVLELGVDEAIEFFSDAPNVANKLKPLQDVGLGYIKLGQSSSTLSGGEAQRVKLASFLTKGKSKEKILFIFDEPTTGLHFNDINKLLHAFFALIENGHSIIVIEHNTAVIKNAQWLIDIGPEGGDKGGELLYAGPPEGLRKVKRSLTANYI